MCKKSAILQISDLHIANEYGNSALSKLQDDSYFTSFKSKLKELNENYKFECMVVSGDISQAGRAIEFQNASKILNEICKAINIEKKNVLLLPGNHDINWEEFEKRLANNKIKDRKLFHQQLDDKLVEFKEFYDTFFDQKKSFDAKKAIVDSFEVEIDDCKVMIIGINTLFHESHLPEDHYGYIDDNKLKAELESIKNRYMGDKFVAVMHHSPSEMSRIDRTINNWYKVVPVFREYSLSNFICGHIHVSNSHAQTTRKNYEAYIGTGSIGIDEGDNSNSFLILEGGVDDINNHVLLLKYFKWEKEGGEVGYWQELTDKADKLDCIIIKEAAKGGTGAALVANSIENQALGRLFDERLDDSYVNSPVTPQKNKYDDLLGEIKNHGLYESGHFHWCSQGRSRSIIKTNYFFEDYSCLENVKGLFLKLVDEKAIKSDLVIGYSMQGCVIGSLIAIAKDWNFTYCPAYAKKYSSYEKLFPQGKYKVITIFVDITYKNNLIKWLKEKVIASYPMVEEINICTLFCSNVDEKADFNDGIIVNIYGVYKIDLNTCPYDNPDKCIVYQEKLDTVHILYSEEEDENH